MRGSEAASKGPGAARGGQCAAEATRLHTSRRMAWSREHAAIMGHVTLNFSG